jgi:hypothetical protein
MAAMRHAPRAAAVLAGLVLSFAGSYALQAAIRSSVPLTAFLSLGVLTLAGALFLTAGRCLATRTRACLAAAGLLAGAAAHLLLVPLLQLSGKHALYVASMARAKAAALDHGLALEQPTLRDGWGGAFHVERIAEGILLVWSDGPDATDDGGSPPVDFRALIAFEKPFDQCYGEPLASLQSVVRWFALRESVLVWRRFRGDLTWRHTKACGLEATGPENAGRPRGPGGDR